MMAVLAEYDEFESELELLNLGGKKTTGPLRVLLEEVFEVDRCSMLFRDGLVVL